jgi:peptide deformylase
VTAADVPHLETLIDHMIAVVIAEGGTGLAAPQVGIFLQLAVVLPKPETAHILINPVITSFGGRDLIAEETCLSLPTGMARVTRSEIVHLETGLLHRPEACEKTTHKGLEARLIQHEVDHLNGIFYINRVSSLQRSMALGKFAKWQKQFGSK